MSYPWQCLACAANNASDAASCAACGCPAGATARDIEACRPKPATTPGQAAQHAAARERWSLEALRASRYRLWYRASVGAFLCALAIPDGAGLYMLLVGWLGARHSLAWFANPLLIAALVMGRPKRDAGAGRGFAYGALVLMFAMPMDGALAYLVVPFLFWVASAVLLIIGMERYRSGYRRVSHRPRNGPQA